jgi:hypothetical protein
VFAIIEEWIAQPGVVVLQPGPRHAEILKQLTIEHSVTGPLVTDAVLAALALEGFIAKFGKKEGGPGGTAFRCGKLSDNAK